MPYQTIQLLPLTELALKMNVDEKQSTANRIQNIRNSLKRAVLCDALLNWVEYRRWWFWTFIVLMYAAGFNGRWRIQPDAALYLSIGRNLAEGHGYSYLGEHDQRTYPGWPSLIGIVFKMFGTHSLVPLNVLVILVALLTLAAVYRLFVLRFDRSTAVVVSVGVGLTKAFYCYGFELWADMLFALGTMAFLSGYEGVLTVKRRQFSPAQLLRRQAVDSVLLFGGLLIALVTRPTIWPLLLAFGCALPIDALRRRIRWRSVLILFTLGAIAVWVLSINQNKFGSVYGRYLFQHLTGTQKSDLIASVARNCRSLLTWAASDVLFQVRLGWLINTLLSIGVLSLGFGLFRYRSLWGFWFLFLLTTILVSQETLDRYFLPVLPLLVFAWWDLLVRLNRSLPKRFGNLVFISLLGFGALMNFTKVCGIIVQQHSRSFLSHYDQGKYEIVPEFCNKLALQTSPDAIILIRAPYGRVTAFLSRRNAQSAAEILLANVGQRPLYVVEPLDSATIRFLAETKLAEGPALFKVVPSRQCDPGGIALSLHATHPNVR